MVLGLEAGLLAWADEERESGTAVTIGAAAADWPGACRSAVGDGHLDLEGGGGERHHMRREGYRSVRRPS